MTEDKKIVLPCYMMATKAIHKLGDISSSEPDICRIESEDDENYIGRWVCGMGFVHVKFPKSSTRKLTSEEVEYFSKQYFQLSGGPPQKLDL